ncbi:MAG: energy transducer TonB [Sphingomonas fennica]
MGEFGNAPPRYPPLSLRKREQGTVRLRVVIDLAGRVRDIAVAVSSGFDRLDRAALDGVRGWRFHPGMAEGRPVDGAVGFLNYTFALRG